MARVSCTPDHENYSCPTKRHLSYKESNKPSHGSSLFPEAPVPLTVTQPKSSIRSAHQHQSSERKNSTPLLLQSNMCLKFEICIRTDAASIIYAHGSTTSESRLSTPCKRTPCVTIEVPLPHPTKTYNPRSPLLTNSH
jgi:hypothetical protein